MTYNLLLLQYFQIWETMKKIFLDECNGEEREDKCDSSLSNLPIT